MLQDLIYGIQMYDIFYIGDNSPHPNAKHADSYEHAKSMSMTKMFWLVWKDLHVLDSFDFLYKADNFSLDVTHVFRNGNHYDGVTLFSKSSPVSKREIDYRFYASKKELEITASMPSMYDIVFISYNEPTADDNFKALQQRFPRAKRVHGVKGIHQAHIAAAKLCDTDMFWIVDGDAVIVDEFNFDYQVPKWNHDHVFVWRAKNPINDMVYGYGGVKLFPTRLTIDMDVTKPDMTTSISSKFNAIKEVSNITSFNTGEFETWKGAFRECTKLSSKVIDRQKNEETDNRLQIWTTIGKNRPYGEYAIRGARAGAAYGAANQGNTEALKKINDFDWLQEQFDATNI
jgi:hypothetical protein